MQHNQLLEQLYSGHSLSTSESTALLMQSSKVSFPMNKLLQCLLL